MTNVAAVLWPRLHGILTAFAARVCAVDPTLTRDVGRSDNDTFPLRGYLAFTRHPQGDEVAITIDVCQGDEQLTIESDVCTDDGTVIATGPTAAISFSTDRTSAEKAIDDWIRAFTGFLEENASAVVSATARLP
jgi:hypothetical protein